MREILEKLTHIIASDEPVAFCRLVETRGSTPQKAGAIMLVRPDGQQHGTLGGGCVEAEVKRRAIAILQRGEPEIATFHLDNDYGWDDGLICGGRMTVVVDPLIPGGNHAYWSCLAEFAAEGRGYTEAIVYDSHRAGLRSAQTYLIDADCAVRASTPADRTSNDRADVERVFPLPEIVGQGLRPLAARPRAYASQGVAFIPNLPRCRLLVVGGGHVGKAVADLAVDLDFDLWVVDDREEFASTTRFSRAERLLVGDIAETLRKLEITPNTYCLIVTRGHSHDEQALHSLIDRGARYVGMIGSRRKIGLIFDDLRAAGVSSESLQKVRAPVGIDIGSQTVAEIAVSIAAELVAHRNLGGIPGK